MMYQNEEIKNKKIDDLELGQLKRQYSRKSGKDQNERI